MSARTKAYVVAKPIDLDRRVRELQAAVDFHLNQLQEQRRQMEQRVKERSSSAIDNLTE